MKVEIYPDILEYSLGLINFTQQVLILMINQTLF